MAETKKPRRAAPASASPAATPQATETKATAEFRRFKEARTSGPAMKKGASPAPSPSQPGSGTVGSVGAGSVGAGFMGGAPWSAGPMPGLPNWTLPPMFSLPQPPQGWTGMMPQPGMVQPGPQAVGPVTDRLGSTLRLGIDVVNMALAGSLRLLGGMGHGHYGHGYGPVCHETHYSCCQNGRYQGNCGCCDCCCVFEHDACCRPSVGSCC